MPWSPDRIDDACALSLSKGASMPKTLFGEAYGRARQTRSLAR